MVVDCILDRKDGSPYNPREFYQDMLAYEADEISRAMDEGTEEDVKKALCDYITFNEYNPDICDYINSVDWLTSSRKNRRLVKSSRRPIQSMYVSEDISGNDLYTRLWSGGKDQFESMIEDGADADDILNACEELLFSEDGDLPTMTDVNDLIWFEPDLIREHLGLSEEPIESGCHGKSKKKGKKKAVKSSMSVRDLPRDALHELKERYYAEKYDQDLSYGELANIDDIVSDEEVFDEYDGTSFTEDDFFCLASSRKAVKSGLYENNGTDGKYWYKLRMLDRMLEAMKVDRYSIPKLHCDSEEFDIKTIDIDEGGIQALVDYYASIN